MWVKICANTSVDDAQMAIDLGADAVGFVFAPSARRVSVEEAGSITAWLEGRAERIGVFQSMDFGEIRRAVRGARLSGVQLHGGFDPELIGALREEFGDGLAIAQTLHWNVGSDARGELLDQVRELRELNLMDRVLVDSKVGEVLGGTGTRFDWQRGRAVFDQRGARMIAAGGLTPGNVREAIEQLQPWGVDVASGVESSPGRKDAGRLRLFLERAKATAF